jgi:hypothetical protein
MLHLTAIKALPQDDELGDVFIIDRSHLFPWSQNVIEQAEVVGQWLANLGLTVPVIMGAIAGLAAMLCAHWQAEGRSPKEATKRAETFADGAYIAWKVEAELIITESPNQLH